MATHPDDHNQPHHGDEHHATPPPIPQEPEDAAGAGAPKPDSPKKTQIARQAGKPTMMAHGDEETAVPAMPNLSLDPGEEEIPVLGAADIDEAEDVPVLEAEPVSDVVEAQPVSDVALATPVDVTGADMPRADVTGAEHVLGDDIAEAFPASSVESGAEVRSDFVAMAEEASGVEEAEAVLGDEPLDRGSRPSARAESPIRAEVDDDVIDFTDDAAEASSAGKKRAAANLEATEPVFAVDAGEDSGTSNWDDVPEVGSGGRKGKADPDKTVAFDAVEEDDDSSAVDLGKSPSKSKSASASSGSSASGIDAVAEALESGVNLDDDSPVSPPKGPPSVEFDDILGEEAEPLPKKKTVKPAHTKKWAAEEEDEVAEAVEAEPARPAKGGKKTKKSAAELEDEAAAALFAEEEDDAVAEAVEDDEGVAVPVDEDEEAVAAPVDEEEEAVAAAVDDDELAVGDEELAPVKSKKKEKPVAPPVSSGPGCLGRMVSATFFLIVGVVLAAGGVVAVAFFAPELIDQVPETPWTIKKTIAAPRIVEKSPIQKAAEALVAGDYAAAIEEVKDETDEPAKAVRGEARVLKLLKGRDLATQPLDKAGTDELAGGLKDLREGKNDTLANQVERSLRELPEAQAKLQGSGKSLDELTKILAKTEAERKDAATTVKDLGAALAGAKKNLVDAQTTVAGVNKILADADIKDAGPKGVQQLLSDKKEFESKLGEVNKVLADAKVKDPGAKGVQEVLDARAKVQMDRDELDAATKAAYAELVKAKVVPEGADPRKSLAEGAKLVREKSESPLAIPLTNVGSSLSGIGMGFGRMVEKGFDTGALAAQLGFFRVREQFIQAPEQKLDTFAELLKDRKLKDPKTLDAVIRETDWVLSKESRASAEARAKALYVSGLALRNQEKFDEARKALDQAAKTTGIKGASVAQAKVALKELSDPQAYYLPQITKAHAAGNLKGAITEANVGLKALPNNGKLLAERGLLRLEMARAGGKIGVPIQQQIRADADAAVKSGGEADGAYVLGLLEEELGQYAKAEALYRQALASHKGTEDAASRYRVALARVLLRDRPAVVAPPVAPAEKGKDNSGQLEVPAAPLQQPAAYIHPLTALVLSVTLGAQPFDEPEPEFENPDVAKRLRESVQLAKTLTSSKDPKIREQGYALLAQAAGKAGTQLTSASCLELAKDLLSRDDPKVKGTGLMLHGQGLVKQGRRTEGLKEYSRGLEMLNPGMESKEVVRMVEEHPAFQHPDSANKPNPLLAEKHFGNGLHMYWTRQYPEAEVQFKTAMDYYGQDARYMYYLGLAQLGQKSKLKRDQAYYSFERGAQLEAQSRPSIAEINLSLERLQGELRQFLNGFRNKEPMATP